MNLAVIRAVVISARAAAHAFLMATEALMPMLEQLEGALTNVPSDARTPEERCAAGDHADEDVQGIPTMGHPGRMFCRRCKQTFERVKEA